MKIILVEADYLNELGETRTMYVANAPFYSAPTDSPANQPYDDFITGGLSVAMAMDEVLQGATTTRFGSVDIINLVDDEVLQGNFSGQQARVYVGKQGTNKAAFKQVFTATIDDLTVNDAQSISLDLRSHNDVFEQPLQQIETGDRGKKKPIAYGECFNVSPVVADKINRIYSVHESAVSAINVRAAGLPVSKNNNLANGQFSFASDQGGIVTSDVTTTINTPKAITLDILNRANVTAIELASLDALPTHEMALYLGRDETPNQALDAIVNSIGWFWNFKRSGEFFVGEFALGVASATLYPDDLQHDAINVKQTIKPVKKITLTYQKNWTPQGTSLDDSLSLSVKETYESKGPVVNAENPTVTEQYPNARTVEKSSLLKDQEHAQNEVNKRALLLSTKRRIYQIKAFDVPFDFELGQTITVVYPYREFTQGKDVLIVGIEDDLLNGESTLEVFA